MKRSVFDLTKIPFLKRLIGISCLIVEVLNDQNFFTESNLATWFSSYVQFCSGGYFSERAEAARWCGKTNHLKLVKSKRKNINSAEQKYESLASKMTTDL